LGHVLHRPALIPTPAIALRLLFGEMADAALLASQRLLPARLETLGFEFQQPTLAGALRSVLHR
jgi:NAD dependent epimerase/dehydratase family enzyme